MHCHWRKSTSPVKVTVNGGGTLLLRAIMVVVPLLLVIAGDVETNPGPEGKVSKNMFVQHLSEYYL